MSHSLLLLSLFPFAAAVPGCRDCPGGDQVNAFGLKDGSEIGVMADGDRGIAEPLVVNDETFTAGGLPSLCLPNFRKATGEKEHNELVAFCRPPAAAATAGARPHPPVAIFNLAWQDGRDKISVHFQEAIAIDVKVWVLHDPDATEQADIGQARQIAEDIWLKEGIGLEVGAWDVADSTGDADLGGLALHFSCGNQGGSAVLKGPGDARFDPGRINVYLVDTVEGSASDGYACMGENVIALGRLAEADLLAHELGHTFTLEHTSKPAGDGLPCTDGAAPCFDSENVMFAKSDDRRYLTEGQVFRAHLHRNSAINSLFHALPAAKQRDCAPLSAILDVLSPMSDPEDNFACPKVEKRIWPDGSFEPN